MAVAALIGIFFSYRVNKKIEYQINQITAYLKQIEAKNFKAEIRPSFASEFFSIAKMLKILALKLEKKERQKRKYTAKLKLKNKQTTEIIEAISHEFKNRYRDWETDRKSTRLNSSHITRSRMPSSA